jgi:hypothetical protein
MEMSELDCEQIQLQLIWFQPEDLEVSQHTIDFFNVSCAA